MSGEQLRVALLTYRGNPYSGGQGVYTRNISRELVKLGHQVEVISGPPYPHLDEGVSLTQLPSLDLYREPDPFRLPKLGEYRDWIDALEVATMCTAGFPEPMTFSLRARRYLKANPGRFDVIHDNQCLGYGLMKLGMPTVTSVHHPIQVDRILDLEAATGWRRRLGLRRWYGFTTMQRRVARRCPHVVTVSHASGESITEHLDVPPERIRVVPIGTDIDEFSPDPSVAKVPNRVVTTTSSDVPLKGLLYLIEAIAKLRTERPVHLIVVGSPRERVTKAVERFGLADTITFTGHIGYPELINYLRSAEVAVVPSLYEGFSIPVAEGMACGTPMVTTTGGALPEVAGPDGEAALLVPPRDASAMATAIGRLLDSPQLRARMGAAARQRVVRHFTWAGAAAATAEIYREAIDAHR